MSNNSIIRKYIGIVELLIWTSQSHKFILFMLIYYFRSDSTMNKLLQILSENSDFTAAQCAAILGTSEEEVTQQIEKYKEDGIILGNRALINWDKVPNSGVTAMIELKVSPKPDTGFDEIAQKVMMFDEVESVYLMAGAYDLLVMVKGENINDVAMFVSKRLSTMESVISTATHFLLKRYKDGGVVFDPEDEDRRSMIL